MSTFTEKIIPCFKMNTPDYVISRYEVPPHLLKHIIGKSGWRKQEIVDAFDINLRIIQSNHKDMNEIKIIEIIGDATRTASARMYIEDLIGASIKLICRNSRGTNNFNKIF